MESHVGLPAWSLLLPLSVSLPLSLSLSLSLTIINKKKKKKKTHSVPKSLCLAQMAEEDQGWC